jgi:hypothetical protein
MVPVEYAEPFGPEYCLQLRDQDMRLARLANRSRHPRNREIVLEAVSRARRWNRLMVQGGNEAHHYHGRRKLGFGALPGAGGM